MSKNLGLGVMINMLGGNEESVRAFQKGINKKITTLEMNEDNEDYDAIYFEFKDGYKMILFDDGQSCCESRYMMTDDELDDFVGSTLLNAEIKDGPEIEDEYGVHEQQFLIITTSIGQFTMVTHNEHNGYYGGFWIVAKQID